MSVTRAEALERVKHLPPAAQQLVAAKLREQARLRRNAAWKPYPWQQPPRELAAAETWLIFGGRGIGKTDGCARYLDQHVNGPPCDPRIPGGHRVAIIAPTLGDAVESCVTGPSGLTAHNPEILLRAGSAGGARVVWPNGASGRLFGAHTPEDVERLRAGGNRCVAWAEEIAAWRYLDKAWQHMRFGLRVGPRPHVVGSTTPKPLKWLRDLLEDDRTLATRGRTSEAYHLAAAVVEELNRDYAGTRLGRQELDGELLLDVEGALWSWEAFAAPGFRLNPKEADDQARVAGMPLCSVAVDPAVTSSDTADATGIVAACSDGERAVILRTLEIRATPYAAMLRAVNLALDVEADTVVVERNNGGDYLGAVFAQVAKEHPEPDAGRLRLRTVNASRGKLTRAQPVAALYEQGRVQHYGRHDRLEEQQATYTGDPRQASPDLLDAAVWALWSLVIERRVVNAARQIRT